MKVAIAGCGTMGSVYARTLARIKGAKLTAVCTADPKRVADLPEYSNVHIFSSYEEMLNAGNADVVCVTVPTFLHKEYVLKAAARGKYIICEKPIALNLPDALAMIDACHRAKAKLFVGHVVRFFPEYENLHRLVSEGTIGRVGVAHAKRASSHPLAGSWFADTTKSGGVILDLMIHDIDFMRWTVGEVKSVFAQHRAAEGVEYATVTLRFENGAIANLEAQWGFPGPFTAMVELAGQNGILRNDNQSTRSLILRSSSTSEQQRQGVTVPAVPAVDDPYYNELVHFMDCITYDRTPIVTAEDACKALEISLAAIRSATSGKPVWLQSADLSVGGQYR